MAKKPFINSLLCALLIVPFLSGCDLVVLNPSGDMAVQQRDLIVVSTILMLLIIVPVIIFTLYFAWKYRASNKEATYDPSFHHSSKLELMIWGVPILIIIILGTLTWVYTHKLDPYRPLDRIDANRAIPADVKPLTVQVVSLDWKWLFIYPEQGIATVNELAAPVDRPIKFELTSGTVMNSFFVPALAGQIYTMAGMKTQLHAVMNKEGTYDGFSANYSGHGFTHMRFKFLGLSQTGFDQWVNSAKSANSPLNKANYQELERPSESVPVKYYSTVDSTLFDKIVNMCVDGTKPCMNETMKQKMSAPEAAASATDAAKTEESSDNHDNMADMHMSHDEAAKKAE